MKVSAVFLSALAAASTASSYRIDLWSENDYQGTQRAYVSYPNNSKSTLS